MKKNKFHFPMIFSLLILLSLNSCLIRKNNKLIYFKNVQDDFETSVINAPKESVIKSSDIIQINLFCQDEEVSKMFAVINSTPASGSVLLSVLSGYLVDDSGMIKLPLLGAVKAAGLNKVQLADTIAKQLVARQFVLDPIVSVRITNFKITFLGEVGKPGVILIPNERISLMDALALAGDLTINGRRDNILLIREKDGKKVSKRFSLNNDEVFNSDNFYLQNQDIIYVESNKYKAAPHDRFSTNLSTVISTFSFLLVLYTSYQLFK